MRGRHGGDASAGAGAMSSMHKLAPALMFFALLASASCGYHVAGKSDALPPTVRSIAVPAFTSRTPVYRIETRLTEAVVREFNTRTRYQVTSTPDNADAVLRGTVTSALVAPLTYDSRTGQASTALVTVAMQVTLTAHDGKVLYQDQNYIFREQYQISRDPSSFFEEEGPSLDRLSRDFARTLVSNILEAF